MQTSYFDPVSAKFSAFLQEAGIFLQTSEYGIYILFGFTLLVLVVPFIPGWREMRNSKDASPLRIDMSYTKNPFFYGDKFSTLIDKNLPALSSKTEETSITLSKRERLLSVSGPVWRCEDKYKAKTLVYAAGDLETGKDCLFQKEVFVCGNAVFGEGNTLRAVFAKNDVILRADTEIARWIDVRGKKLAAGERCNLGSSAACKGALLLHSEVRFTKLFGNPVVTAAARGGHEAEVSSVFASGDIRESALVSSAEMFSVPSNAELHSNIISRQNLHVCSGAVIHGDIKCYRDVRLETGVTVHGTIIADGNITIGPLCVVRGNVFSQRNIDVMSGTVIGEAGTVRTLVCKDVLSLGHSVSVYGFVTCEQGEVAAEDVNETPPAGQTEKNAD